MNQNASTVYGEAGLRDPERFTGSHVSDGARHTDFEPGIPGGETPPSTAGGTPAATDDRFMESPLFKNDLLTGHEPWREEWSGRPSSRPSPGGRRRTCAASPGGISRALAGTSRDGSHGWSLGVIRRGTRDTLSLRERVGVREPVSTLAIAGMERFKGSPQGSRIAYWDHEPAGDSPQRHGGTELKAVCLISRWLGVSVVETGSVGSGVGDGATPAARERVPGFLAAVCLLLVLLLGLHVDAAMLPGRTVVTVGTSAQASDGSEWGYLFLNETDTEDAGCSDCPSVAVPVAGLPVHPASPTGYVAVYAKEGAAGSTNTFVLKSVLTRATDPFTIRALLERSRRLGDVPELIDERLTTLFGPLVPASSIDVAEKLSGVIRGAAGVEDHEQNLRLMARQHPGIAMCLGVADAQAISTTPGVLTTFELRQWNPSVNQDGPVIGRVTVTSRQPLSLPPPFAPVLVPDATAKGDLNLKLRWAMTDELKRVALVSQGFDVFRVDRVLAEDLGWHLTPPTTVALLSALTTRAASVVRVNDVPVLAGQNYSEAGAADLTNDPTTTFVLDDNDRFDAGGRPFIDGAEFYYFVGARDLLGRVGTLSPGTLGRVCDRIPPSAPREVRVRALHLWDGTTAKDRLEVSWKPYTAAGTEMPAAYYVYRWNGPTAALSPSARSAVPVAGPILHDPAPASLHLAG
jgi:hypothetical protein